MVGIYILKLQEGKYYIGSSEVPISHSDSIMSTDEWCIKYGPLIERIIINCKDYDEEYNYTKQLILEYGICDVRSDAYNYDTIAPMEMFYLQEQLKRLTPKCYRCEQEGHFSTNCIKEESKSETIQDLQLQIKQIQLEFATIKEKLTKLTRRHNSVAGYVKHLTNYLWGYKSSA